MKTTHRDYSEEQGDFKLLTHFFTQHPTPRRKLSTWCLGRVVDWKYAIYESKRLYASFCEENAHAWFDGYGDLAGFAISESGDSGFHILTLDGYRFLYEEMLEWVLDSWKGRASSEAHLSTEVTEFQDWEIAILEHYGFCREFTYFTRRFDLTCDLPPRSTLEPGFVIVDMKTHPDLRALGVLRANAFQKKDDISEEEIEERVKYSKHSMNDPIYHPDTDVYVMAADGRFAAGCEALINAPALEADIERVCTHSDFRRRGFARAAILECMHRLKEIGIQNVYITGYGNGAVALYGSLGHADEVKSFIYELRN